MASEVRNGPNAASRQGGFPLLTEAARSAADAQLVGVIEQSQGGTLGDDERSQLRASVAAQSADIDVLRRFALANDDAPCFAIHRTKEFGNAG